MSGVRDEERIAVRGRAGDQLGADEAGRAGPVVRHHVPAQLLREALRDDAAHDVG
jgi:hypothetical protein